MVCESGLRNVQRNTEAPDCKVHMILVNLHLKKKNPKNVGRDTDQFLKLCYTFNIDLLIAFLGLYS